VNTKTDQELVRAYALENSEAAFAELVRRHVHLVYSVALRLVVDPHLAEDVTQGTFVALAQNARKLAARDVLSSWLHLTARNLAAKLVRSEERRRAREKEAVAMEIESHEPEQVWSKVVPHLDEAIGCLSDKDRDALMLRFFERKSAQDMAMALDISEEAAQKRVTRAVERLRGLLAKRGLAVGASALVIGLSTHTVQAAPASLAATLSTAALAGATAAKAATVGTGLAQHGSVAAKTTALGGFLQTSSQILLGFVYWMAPVLPLGGYIGYKMGGDRQHSERARRSVATFWRIMGASMLLFVFLPPLLLVLIWKIFNLSEASIRPIGVVLINFPIPVFIYTVAPLSLVIWVWQRRRPIGPETAGGAQISNQAGKSTTLWVMLAMTAALVCLAVFFLIASASSRIHIPQAQYLSTAEVQNLIANSKGRDIEFSLTQLRNGFRNLNAEGRENGTEYVFHAPAENSTMALLAEKGISYKTSIEGRDFNLGIRAVLWSLGNWAFHLLMPAFCFFIVVAGAVTLLRRRDHQPSEPRPIAAARNERRVDKAFAALAACGMVALAVLLGLTTDWKVRRVAADQVPGIIAQHKNARFEVFEYRDGSRKLWISDLRSPDFIAPADESTLGLLTRQGITYQTCLAEIHGWWYRHPSMLGTSSAQPHPSSSGRPGLSQSTSALGILVLAAAAGTVLWWVMKRKPISTSRI